MVLLLFLLFVPSSLSISFPHSPSFPHLLLGIVRFPYLPFFVFSLFAFFVSCFLCLLCVFKSYIYIYMCSLSLLYFWSSLFSSSSLSLASFPRSSSMCISYFSIKWKRQTQDRQDHQIIHIVFFPDKNIQKVSKSKHCPAFCSAPPRRCNGRGRNQVSTFPASPPCHQPCQKSKNPNCCFLSFCVMLSPVMITGSPGLA